MAGTVRGGLPACRTEEDLSEFVNNYSRMIQEGRCVMLKPGLEVVVLSGVLTLKVRVYLPSGKSVVLFTPAENVKR
jgi:hypothetical protein